MQVGDPLWHAVLPVVNTHYGPKASYIMYEEWRVVALTAHGAWAVRSSDYDEGCSEDLATLRREGRVRWTAPNGKYLSETQEQALGRLQARTRSYVKHCKRRLQEAQVRLDALNNGTAVENPPLRIGAGLHNLAY